MVLICIFRFIRKNFSWSKATLQIGHDLFHLTESFKCEFGIIRMAGVFDIELHDGDATNQDESDDDVIDTREVECIFVVGRLYYICNCNC